MSKNPNTVVTEEEEFDAILPEGWSGEEGADIFDPATWGGIDTAADALEDEDAEEAGNSSEETDDQTRATEDDADSQTEPEQATESPATTQSEPSDGILRFRVTIDHVPQDVEVTPEELPSLYEKSHALDRYKQRLTDSESELARWDNLAAGLQFENREALLTGLMENAVQDYIAEHPSVPEEMARDFVMRRFQVAATKPAPKTEDKPAENGRDYKQEVADLFRAYPAARTERIPEEVTTEALTLNKPLVQAYADWKARTASAEATRAKRENKILKQNQAAAAKAPVSKVTGGGRTVSAAEDDFLKGFNDDSAW